MSNEKVAEMTDEQIANWRDVLSMTIGIYAMTMPVEQIIEIRDSMQADATKMVDNDAAVIETYNPPLIHNITPKESKFDEKNNWFQKALRKDK